jgi:signal-transduction protein with cAMP-binding, CBS, and nucleotidyltransferase domain
VIITAYNDPDKPVGIFTERDLLKWALQIGGTSHWNTAIGHVMTKNLITITTSDLDQANDLMIRHHIRHLPVVYHDDDGVSRLAGIVSMRDAFKKLVLENKQIRQQLNEIENKPSITVLAKTATARKLQTSLLASRANLQFLPETSNGKEIIQHLQHSQAFVFDIDAFDPPNWTSILRAVLESESKPDLFLVMDPKQHEGKVIETLKTMQSGNVLNVFFKPINLIQYLGKIEGSFKHI